MTLITQHSAKVRLTDANNQPTGSFLYYRLKPGAPAPGRGGRVLLSADWESITEAQYLSLSTDCGNTAVTTYTFVKLWSRRPIYVAPTYHLNGTPKLRYERGFGMISETNANGPCYVRLAALDGQAFTDIDWYAGFLYDGDGNPGSFKHEYADSMPAGRYRTYWRSESSPDELSADATVVRSGTPPYVARPFADWLVSAPGPAVSQEIAGVFVDPDNGILTYSADANGAPLPAWLLFNPLAARPFTVVGDAPNTSLAITIKATDPDNMSVTDPFLLTVARRILLKIAFNNNPATVNEGSGVLLAATATYQTGNAESSEALNLSQAQLFLAGPNTGFSAAYAEVQGVQLGSNGLFTASINPTTGDSRIMRVKLDFGGKTTTVEIQVVDTTNSPAPPPPPPPPTTPAIIQVFREYDVELNNLFYYVGGRLLENGSAYVVEARSRAGTEGWGDWFYVVKSGPSHGMTNTSTWYANLGGPGTLVNIEFRIREGRTGPVYTGQPVLAFSYTIPTADSAPVSIYPTN